MLRSIVIHTISTAKHRLSNFFQPQPQLALAPAISSLPVEGLTPSSLSSSPTVADCLWLAVPKSKITRSKKRMKTTLQKRIKVKNHVMVDSRTGEMKLRHCLPLNWKEYLPKE
mmetsp:Transcript_15358/g.19483  ORF Transcript_15358/g.19483 Transcript_15358/m.19483 type:complete len:113 (+) Transcript_15358:169-507(+)